LRGPQLNYSANLICHLIFGTKPYLSKSKDLIRNGVWPCERSYEKDPMPLEQID